MQPKDDDGDDDDSRSEQKRRRAHKEEDTHVTPWLVCCVESVLYIGGAPNYFDVRHLTRTHDTGGCDVRVFVNLRPLSGETVPPRARETVAPPRELAYARHCTGGVRVLHAPLPADFEPQGRLKEERLQSRARHYAQHALRIYKDLQLDGVGGGAVYVHKDNGRGEEVLVAVALWTQLHPATAPSAPLEWLRNYSELLADDASDSKTLLTAVHRWTLRLSSPASIDAWCTGTPKKKN